MKALFNNKITAIVNHILYNSSEEISVRKISRDCKVSPGLVSLAVGMLRNLKLVRRTRVVQNHPYVRALKILFNVEVLFPLVAHIKKIKGVRGIGVYGSWAKGTNVSKSDVDLWVKVDVYPDAIRIARLRAVIRKKLGAEPSFLFVTKEKIENMKRTNLPLYFSLIHSFLLWGEFID